MAVNAQTSLTRSIWVASCTSCGGLSGRSLAGRKDQPTGTRHGARSLSRTHRWRGRGGTITTSRLCRWCARTKCSTSRISTSWVWSPTVGSHGLSAMRGGGSSCGSLARRPTATGAPCMRSRGGWRRARPARRAGTESTNCPCISGSGRARLAGHSRSRPQRRQGHSRRRAGGETKRLHTSGRSREAALVEPASDRNRLRQWALKQEATRSGVAAASTSKSDTNL